MSCRARPADQESAMMVPRGGPPRPIEIRGLSEGGTPFYRIWALGFCALLSHRTPPVAIINPEK
jgi:hypothetical protein